MRQALIVVLVAFAAIGVYIAGTKYHCHDAAFTQCHAHYMTELFHGHN